MITKLKNFNENLININNMKNTVQVFNWLDIDANNDLRDMILDYYREDLCGSDTYVRYYPNDGSYISEELQKMINDYLIKDGYFIDYKDKYFYILIRIDW